MRGRVFWISSRGGHGRRGLRTIDRSRRLRAARWHTSDIRPLFLVASSSGDHQRGPRRVCTGGRDRIRRGNASTLPHRFVPSIRASSGRVAFLTLFGIVNFSDALLILRAKALGLGFVGIIGAWTFFYNLTYAGLSYPAGRLLDCVPRRIIFATGLAVFAVSYLGLGVVTTSGWVWPLLAVYGAFTALTDGVGELLDHRPAAARATRQRALPLPRRRRRGLTRRRRMGRPRLARKRAHSARYLRRRRRCARGPAVPGGKRLERPAGPEAERPVRGL